MTTKEISLLIICAVLVACATAPRATWFPAPVAMIEKEYENIDTTLTEASLARHGITHGSTFRFRFKGRQHEVFLGKTYSDVDKGKWVALIEEAGNLQIAISFGHAAKVIQCAVGDTLYILSMP